MVYLIILSYLVIVRVLELLIAKSNENYQKAKGAIEIEDPYYKHIVMTHVLFFIFLTVESLINHSWDRNVSTITLSLFLILQFFRYWILWSLGRNWNTKVIVLPDANLVEKGPYKWIKHPNYWIVGLEFLVISILFYAYITAIVFVSAHLWLMTKRIPLENRALKQYLTNK